MKLGGNIGSLEPSQNAASTAELSRSVDFEEDLGDCSTCPAFSSSRFAENDGFDSRKMIAIDRA